VPWEHALSLYASFPSSVRDDHTVQTSLLSLCAQAPRELSLALLEEEMGPHTQGYNALLRQATWEDALVLLAHVQKRCTPDIESYNNTLRALRMAKMWERALALLDEVSQSLTPTIVTYNEVLYACQRGNKPSQTRRILQEMKRDGCTPNILSYQFALRANSAHWEAALAIYEESRTNCAPDAYITSSILHICGKHNQWILALHLFDTWNEINPPTTALVNATIFSLRDGQSQGDALRLLKTCKTPDVITFTATIAACSDWYRALQLFNRMKKTIPPNKHTESAIVKALAKEQPKKAIALFSSFTDRDSTLLNTALLAYDSLGEWRKAVELLKDECCDATSYRTVIDMCERHEQFSTAEDLVTQTDFALSSSNLNLHGLSRGVACAAVRQFLRAESPRDLVLVTGQGKHGIRDALCEMGERMLPPVAFEKDEEAGQLRLSMENWKAWADSGG